MAKRSDSPFPKLLTIRQVVERLGVVSDTFVRELVSRGELPAYRLQRPKKNRKTRGVIAIDERDLLDWLERSRSALIIDLDNDGDQDFVISTNQALLFLENTGSTDGTPSFVARATLPVERDIVSMAAADYDNDGNLDIYACTYHARSDDVGRFAVPIPYHDANNGGANILLRNNGRWTDFSLA